MYNLIDAPLKGFISYSHADAKEVIELKKRLNEFITNHKLTIWYDREIDVGTKWKPEIEAQLTEASIVIFCITDSFLQSTACRSEFRKSIDLKRTSYSEIIPIILKECKWIDEKEVSDFQVTPEYGKAVYSFETIDEAYEQIKKVLDKKIDLVLRRKQLKFQDDFQSELQSLDPLLTVSGAEHLDLKLDDIYVDLELNDQHDNGNDAKPIQGRELVEKLISGEQLLVSGDSQSGKTSLCKNLCIQLFSKCHFPVYLTGKFDYQGNPSRLIDRAVQSQYTDADCIDRKRIILIFDDFHQCRHFEKFLTELPRCCSVLLIFDDIYSLHLMNAVSLKEYHPFSILPLRARKRDELIKKWLESSHGENFNHGPLDNYQTHDRLANQVESTLGKMLGRGLIPAYPFYILSILITSEISTKPLNQEISSQGYCYQVLLYAVLWRVGVRNQQMDMYVNFLSELAYMLFKKNGAGKCSEDDLAVFVDNYKAKFNLPVSSKLIFDKLKKARVFGKDALGFYDFYYPYLKYYFIAKYMAEHYGECKVDFERVFSNLGNSANSYIAIFVAHHEHSIHYLNMLLEKTSSVLKGVGGCYLANTDLRDFDRQSRLIVQAALPLPNNNPDREREKLLEEKERTEDIQTDISSPDDEISDPEFRDFVIAIRLCQVIGQILKIRPASIPSKTQKKMILGVIDTYARLLRVFFNTFTDKASQEAIIDYISHVLEEQAKDKYRFYASEKVRNMAERIFWNLNFVTTYGLVLHCVSAIGSTELSTVIDESCQTKVDAPLMLVIPQMVKILYKKEVDVDGIKKVFPKLSSTVKNILRFVVVYYCRTHHVLYRARQQVEQLFDLTPPRYRLLKLKNKFQH